MTKDVATIDVVVRDGSTVRLRRTEERDVEALLQFLGSLFLQSLYYRFLLLPSLTAARVRALANTDGRRYIARRGVVRSNRGVCRLLGPRIAPPGAMRGGVKAHRMFLADDDVTASAHRAWDHRPIASARLNSRLAGDPDAAAE